MKNADEKKPPEGGVAGGSVLWRVRQLPGAKANGRQELRIEADSKAARELLGDLDIHGHFPMAVIDRARTTERDPETGGHYTVALTLVLNP